MPAAADNGIVVMILFRHNLILTSAQFFEHSPRLVGEWPVKPRAASLGVTKSLGIFCRLIHAVSVLPQIRFLKRGYTLRWTHQFWSRCTV